MEALAGGARSQCGLKALGPALMLEGIGLERLFESGCMLGGFCLNDAGPRNTTFGGANGGTICNE